ncbi:hypothetical protein F5Y08DRAFT_308263, partial [Xylaria arbuscula]
MKQALFLSMVLFFCFSNLLFFLINMLICGSSLVSLFFISAPLCFTYYIPYDKGKCHLYRM